MQDATNKEDSTAAMKLCISCKLQQIKHIMVVSFAILLTPTSNTQDFVIHKKGIWDETANRKSTKTI